MLSVEPGIKATARCERLLLQSTSSDGGAFETLGIDDSPTTLAGRILLTGGYSSMVEH